MSQLSASGRSTIFRPPAPHASTPGMAAPTPDADASWRMHPVSPSRVVAGWMTLGVLGWTVLGGLAWALNALL